MPPFLPSTALLFGTTLLIHACYSAYEHSLLLLSTTSSPSSISNTPPITTTNPTSSSALPPSSLPLDITLETLLSVLILCAGIVSYSQNVGDTLKPIRWRVWAAGVEHGFVGVKNNGMEGGGGQWGEEGGLYKALEKGRRRGFVDIRAQRKDFADWVRSGSNAGR